MVAFDRYLYVFGGAADSTLPNDLHCFDLETQNWSVLKPSFDSQVPSGRLFHAAAVIGDAMYIFGGTVDNNVRSGEMYRFQFSCYPKCTLIEDFGKILRNRLFCDVEFVVGSEEVTIPAHIAMVAARSQWLRNKIRKARSIRERHLEKVFGTTEVLEKNLPILRVDLSDSVPEAFQMVLNFVYTDHIDPTEKIEQPVCIRIVLLIMDVYRLAEQFHMLRLEELCMQYLEVAISHCNVLEALHNASKLQLFCIKEYCLKYIVNESNFNQIVMSKEFETLEQPLMVEIIRRRQMPHVRSQFEPRFEDSGTTLEQDMELFLNTSGKEFTDITLMLDGIPVPAHKAILAARCTYFEGMFRSFMPDDNIVNKPDHSDPTLTCPQVREPIEWRGSSSRSSSYFFSTRILYIPSPVVLHHWHPLSSINGQAQALCFFRSAHT
uniref:(California timema) hypothetical protein n=1 Tax=Timema californicum TaxID=61474 RepID=A0A7R9IWQ4_TIMCA|nr:unnamed protein product [Timema californicum]